MAHRRSRRRVFAVAALVVAPAAGACIGTTGPAGSDPTLDCTATVVFFPVNLVADAAVNTALMLTYPITVAPFRDEPTSNLVGLIVLVSPVAGPVFGARDAWHGYPFWDPVFLDQRRRYRTCIDGEWTLVPPLVSPPEPNADGEPQPPGEASS
jgi:hypothetical protein